MRAFAIAPLLCGCVGASSGFFPGRDILEKYACAVAAEQLPDDAAIHKACALMTKDMPSVALELGCRVAVEAVWGSVKARCSKHQSWPDPQDIQKYVCEVADQKLIEEMATERICGLINKQFPGVHFDPDCRTALEKAWDTVKAFCPTGRLALPAPQDLKKYVCEVVDQKLIEEKATDKVCQLINKQFPGVHFDPDCRTVLESAWDAVKALCPTGRLELPDPQDIEKYVCEVADQKLIEEMATDRVCGLINKQFPGVHFDPDCRTVLKNAWDAVKALCPKGHLTLPDPQDIEKYVCEVADQKLIEDMATDEVCKLISKEFPGVQFEPDCHTVLEQAWDAVKAFCPHGRLSWPDPHAIEKYVCEVADQKLIEDEATDEVCNLIGEKFPGIHFEPDCHTVLEKAWDTVKALCPTTRLSWPSPHDIEKYACEVADQKLIEDEATDEVCKLIEDKFPGVHFQPDCRTALEKAWDSVKALCPKTRLSWPSPGDIKKYACEVADQKLIEDEATDEVCKLIEDKFPGVHFKPDCHTALEKAWDSVKALCPKKARLSWPRPGDIEKYACEVADQKLLEDEATDEVCKLIEDKFPNVHFKPDCHTALEKAWDSVKALCPKKKARLSWPSPGDIEKYACEVADQKLIEDEATDEVCKLIEDKFPGVHFKPDCHTALEKAWDSVKALCPKKTRLSWPSPCDIEKYVCEVADQKLIEDEATDEVCKLIEDKFPGVHFKPDCHTALEKAWDSVKALCPKRTRMSWPSPGDIEKYACEVADQKLIEDEATDEVCKLIEDKFPGVHFKPDCHTALEKAWDSVKALCPKARLSWPSPGDVEKYACEVADQKLIEDEATDEVCKLIEDNFPDVHFKPDCHTALEKAWDAVKALCPKARVFWPSPDDIEKYACEVADQKLIEDEATDEVCKLIEEKFPGVQFKPDCQTVLEKAWDEVKALCPKARLSLPDPEDIAQRVCEVADQKLIEMMATEKVCELLKVNFPNIHLKPDCHTAVEKAWDTVKALCPKRDVRDPEQLLCKALSSNIPAATSACRAVAFPSLQFNCEVLLSQTWAHVCPATPGNPMPQEIEKLVCELAKHKTVERRAASTICKALHVEFPALQEFACRAVVGRVWARAASRCPKRDPILV